MNEKKIVDPQNGLTYLLVGDYYYPLISVEEPRDLGKYGDMHLSYLEECKPECLLEMLMHAKLFAHCAEIDAQAKERMERMMEEFMQAEGVTEELKAADQMEWTRRMNSIQNRAEEIVKAELIFC